MKKTLYIIGLIFMLATTAGYGQSQQADSLLTIIEQATEQLRAELSGRSEPDVPVTDLQAVFISKNIMEVSWTPGHSGKVDIHYYAPGTHREWQHSVATYTDSVDSSTGSVQIGVGIQSQWLVKANRPGWESEVIEVLPWQDAIVIPEPAPAPDSRKFYGYWDHPSAPATVNDYVNVGKSLAADDAQAIVNQGLPVIPLIAGFRAGDSPQIWKKRLEDKAGQIPATEHVPFILLIDEPYSKGWNDAQLETLIDLAKEAMPEYKFGYTVMTLTIMNRPERQLPQNADYIGINYYPFRILTPTENEQQFREDLERTMHKAREKIDTRFFLVGQGFYDDVKWYEPIAESPIWYANAVRETPDVYGLLWFEWRNRENWQGVRSIPGVRERIEQAGGLFERDWSY